VNDRDQNNHKSLSTHPLAVTDHTAKNFPVPSGI
jgi:hypothetical protein